MALPLLNKLLGDVQTFITRSGIRGGEVHHTLTAQPAHARVGHRLRYIILEVVHVVDRGHATADHLGAGQLRAQPHKLRRDKFAFGWQHVAI